VDEMAFRVHAPRARRRHLLELGQCPCAPLLRELDQAQEHLGRRLRVRECPVAGADRDAEEVGEGGKVRPRRATAEQVAGERHGVDHGRVQALAGHALELAVHEADVEARVVRYEDGAAGEDGEASQRKPDAGAWRSSSSVRPVRSPTGRGSGVRGATSVWYSSASSSPRIRTAPISQIREEACERPVVSRSKTTNSARSRNGSGGRRERDERAAPAEAGVAVDERAQE